MALDRGAKADRTAAPMGDAEAWGRDLAKHFQLAPPIRVSTCRIHDGAIYPTRDGRRLVLLEMPFTGDKCARGT